MEIGIAIRMVRTRLMITQGQFAQLCSLSQNALSQIETGRKTPGSATMGRISRALGVPLHLLHLIALQEKDVAAAKREAYRLVHPVIAELAIEMANNREWNRH